MVLFLALAFLIIVGVFWWLKLTGITLAGEAFCKKTEHTHDDACFLLVRTCNEEHEHTESCYEKQCMCGLEEHTHTSECYSDMSADVETASDWEATFSEVKLTLTASKRLVEIAKTQLGYSESVRNFKVDSDGVRHGYTRYGDWYGNPHGEWSAMFVSFCLRQAGMPSVPISAGAETMRIGWEKAEIYRGASEYLPFEGDIAFLDKNGNGSADAAAVVVGVEGNTLLLIEGDVDGKVAATMMDTSDKAILGYGETDKQKSPVLVSSGTLYMNGASSVASDTVIAKTINYSSNMFTSSRSFVIYTTSGDVHYAIDGNGNAVRIYIDSSGNITSDAEDPNILLWTFSSQGTAYRITNVSTGKKLYASGSSVVTSNASNSTVQSQNDGTVRIRGANNTYASLNTADSTFKVTTNQNNAAKYKFGYTTQAVLWLDGTCGGLRSLSGSPDRAYISSTGSVIKLPSSWQTPSKYEHTLRGWYDVTHAKYYRPGDEFTVEENTVMYADWVAATYDIGQFNAQTVNTVSTDEHITVRLFDYNYLINIHSMSHTGSISQSSHSESWSHVASGKVAFRGDQTINFLVTDHDSSNKLSNPSNRNSINNYYSGVTENIYNATVGEMLFGTDNDYDPSTGKGIVGKTYVGEGDYLFKYVDDPNSEYYGYYTYDAALNAASYNQSEGRFYVYEYLARTSDSANGSGTEKYSDFLPLNSPYANTNGNKIPTYTYSGTSGEYEGVSHYTYDLAYSGSNNSADNVMANLAFGMSMELRFHLSDVPGTQTNGKYGNLDLYGKDMHFKFAGDDDVWVLLDGEVILDLGGIHESQAGDINFSSGIVTVNGKQKRTLYDVAEGDHTLTVYYLERGSSQSNSAFYFNVVPRFSLDIQKEDVLSSALLDGAEFSVYLDEDCTQPAQLWESKAAYEAKETPANTFTVTNGIAHMWGLSPGKTYYIKETKPPGIDGYSRASGIICLYIDKRVITSSTVEIVPEWDVIGGDPIDVSPGYTVHGFEIKEDTQSAFIKVTNAQDWVVETTTVLATKKWNDTKDHSGDFVTVYLTVRDPDGTVRRIRQIDLSAANNWHYIWTNIPKYGADMVTPIIYGVEEAYKQGYQTTISPIEEMTVTKYEWGEALSFVTGYTYILGTPNGYLSATSSTAQTLCYVDEDTAKNSSLALWTATVSGGKVKFTNGEGQILTFNYSSSSSSRYYYVTKSSSTYQSFTATDTGDGFTFYASRNNQKYYMTTLGSNGRISVSTSSGKATEYIPWTLAVKTTTEKIEGMGFEITNTPLDEETSVKVNKVWFTGTASPDIYQRLQVTIKLYADGKDTGQTITLSLKNGWSDTFLGLPYKDADGNVIVYTVVESWDNEDWTVRIGEMQYNPGTPGSYEVTVTNIYKWGQGFELPATGGTGYTPWVLSGAALMLVSLVSGCILRRKRKGGIWK